MKLSIIVPVYNAADHIMPLLTSILMQDTNGINMEYIFVFDSCKDNSREIVETVMGLYKKDIKCFDVDFHAAGLTRNKGIANATGDYIWCLDDDDWLTTDQAFKHVYGIAMAYRSDLFKINYDMKPEFETQFNLRQVFAMPWQWVFKRSFFEPFPGEPAVGYDSIWAEKMLRKAGVIEDVEGGGMVFNNLLQSTKKIYYYNFLRQGSAMREEYDKKGGKLG